MLNHRQAASQEPSPSLSESQQSQRRARQAPGEHSSNSDNPKIDNRSSDSAQGGLWANSNTPAHQFQEFKNERVQLEVPGQIRIRAQSGATGHKRVPDAAAVN